MKWKKLTPAQLDVLATYIDSHAHDMKVDSPRLAAENGFDVVGSYEALATHLRKEAEKRAAIFIAAKLRSDLKRSEYTPGELEVLGARW